MEATIKVKIDPLGNPTIEVNGVSGESCEDATRAIEAALAGSGGVERVFKQEWHEQEDDTVEVHEHQW